jgi:hypothetical protein
MSGFRLTSASSSNINPYDESGASGASGPTPWQASSGASRVINWPPSVNYSHNDNRNNIWNADVSFQTSMIIHQLVSEVGLPSYSTRKYRNKR